MQYKYKVIKKSEEGDLLSTIEKTGGKVEFTLADIRASLVSGKKKISEFQSMWKVAEATKENIKRTHPHIAEMSMEDLTAAYLYRQAIGTATEASKGLADWQEAVDEDEKALEDILEQTGLQIPQIITEEIK